MSQEQKCNDIDLDSFELLCEIVDAFECEITLASNQKMTVRKIQRARSFLHSTKKTKSQEVLSNGKDM